MSCKEKWYVNIYGPSKQGEWCIGPLGRPDGIIKLDDQALAEQICERHNKTIDNEEDAIVLAALPTEVTEKLLQLHRAIMEAGVDGGMSTSSAIDELTQYRELLRKTVAH